MAWLSLSLSLPVGKKTFSVPPPPPPLPCARLLVAVSVFQTENVRLMGLSDDGCFQLGALSIYRKYPTESHAT